MFARGRSGDDTVETVESGREMNYDQMYSPTGFGGGIDGCCSKFIVFGRELGWTRRAEL